MSQTSPLPLPILKWHKFWTCLCKITKYTYTSQEYIKCTCHWGRIRQGYTTKQFNKHILGTYDGLSTPLSAGNTKLNWLSEFHFSTNLWVFNRLMKDRYNLQILKECAKDNDKYLQTTAEAAQRHSSD